MGFFQCVCLYVGMCFAVFILQFYGIIQDVYALGASAEMTVLCVSDVLLLWLLQLSYFCLPPFF